MSESDEDLMPNIGFQYQHNSRGNNANTANFHNTNMTSYTFGNNMTSKFNMADMQRKRYGMQGFDQRSMYYRRETSPMSLRSIPDSQMQNFHKSFYGHGMSSQRSVFNGRSGSPASMRSIDSNASVSAKDIALAFKNVKFNKYDLKLIKEAYNQFMKKRVRKRIEKRRNLKLFLKNNRRKSGDDSGEQGSDSSISSDDCRSTRTFYKENLPTSKTLRRDLSNFRNTIRESDMLNDCTENIRQNSLKNKFAINSTLSHNHTSHDRLENMSTVTLKERFTKGSSFLLPSQRFNKSIAKPTSNQTLHCNLTNNINKNSGCSSKINSSHETDSDKDEIFPEVTMRENIEQNSHRKRLLENEENNCSARKKNKITLSPIKHNDTQLNDFNFKKPQMPAKKSLNVNKNVSEVLIAKSRQPLTESIHLEPISSNNLRQEHNLEDNHTSHIKNKDLPQNSTEIADCSNQKDVTQSSDVSMRPSFIKRKLFTQNMDVAEKKNASSDNLGVNSPETKLYSECGEKNRVRKLVTSQSCLSRDVLGDDNVLDLIHKIVPPDQINITNATNKKESNKSNRDNDDRWDVTSVISMCNDNDGSDTFTDEEIFKAPVNVSKKTNNKEVNNVSEKLIKAIKIVNKPKDLDVKKLNTPCKVVVQELQPEFITDKIVSNDSKCKNKRTVSMCVKSFWDTDFESDIEDKSDSKWKSRHQPPQAKDVLKDTSVAYSNFNLSSKRNVAKGTILTVRSFQNKGLNSSKSDISRISKQKESDITINQEKSESHNETLNKNSKSKQINNKEIKKQEKQNSKSKKDTKSSEKNKSKNEKAKVNAKEKNSNNNIQEKLNTTRESLRLKQKKENANLSIDTAETKKEKPTKKSLEKNTKKNNQNNKKSKETSNKDIKTIKNPSIKNATLNRTRQTPRKLNEKKQLSTPLTDHASLNISNISNRSLRIRQKVVK